MQVSDFDFELPEYLIAKRPLEARDASRLLCIPEDGGALVDSMIRDLPLLVKPGDVWVLNDTRVIPARLVGNKPSGGRVEILLLEPAGENNVWLAWGKSNKPLKPGTIVVFSDSFSAEVLTRDGKNVEVLLCADDVPAAIESHGHMPLPPYIDRPDSREDRERYQTVFARHAGAVAAPTAGLHLTSELMAAMQQAGATFAHVTLHVGPGTFQPVQVDDVNSHVMHEEAYIVPEQTAETVNRAKAEGRRIVAVGTTSLRTLEAASAAGELKAGAGRTSIFIYPGYHFRTVDALLTNFHLPKSTLIMLVAALAGRARVLDAYTHARESGYRFYSYGDAMFVPKLSDA
ncbi:S-adenosylmethionine--tRNA ribosyltransferase-isomerase [Mariprofundus ferrinatatus]|uniref:S-adenosylmethionine:tRNA ribosyltransferase-isomerase n=1 Tax=Mariprofundus ferrinatatus TaxID=1921087 RepID=A0A2K8L593_9PROT|nr:tRNA preQ1(34) S-adenosylmethionine ribosyltransferase-isomerase QueA [Mariprofundus ferrinatatus]ATX82413.1 S-adenosylmethionine--tRNA ribosyltransferase-isomerase [Mariprofundus ferrinatatus]